MKNIIISGLVGGIVIFLLGGLFYAGLFADFFASNMPEGMENVPKAEPELGLIFCADLISGLLLAIIYDKWANVRNFSQGATLGLIVGLGISLHYGLIFGGTTNLTTPMTSFADVAISTVMLAIGGGVVGLVLGKMSKASA